MYRHGVYTAIAYQVGVGAILNAGTIVRLSGPLKKAHLPFGRDVGIAPSAIGQMLIKQLHLLTNTLYAVVDTRKGFLF